MANYKYISHEQHEKMKKWHDGKRDFNYKACCDDKLEICYRICKDEGFTAEAAILREEMKKRHLLDPRELTERYGSIETYCEVNGNISITDKSFYDTYYRLYDRICDALKDCLEMYGEERIPLSEIGFREYDDIHISGSTNAVVFDRDGYDYSLDNLEFVELCSLTDKLYDYCLKKVNGLNENKKSVYNNIMEKLSVIVKQSLKENEYWDEPIRDDEEVDILSDTEEWLRAIDAELNKADNNQLYYVWLKAIYYGDVDNEQVYEFVNNLMNRIARSRTDLIVDEVFIDSAVEMLTVDYCGNLMKNAEEKYIYNYGEL